MRCTQGWAYLLVAGLAAEPSLSQWSTSPNIDSVLYVCPGFYPGIVSYIDGSSIILGAYSNSIYVQKLDGEGFSQWSIPVLAHNHDSSAIGAGLLPIEPWGAWISDGNGGVILLWFDHRGSYSQNYSYRNNAIFAQRVDCFGTVLWGSSGIDIKGVSSGLKQSSAVVDDGDGGFIVAWADDGFGYPGSPN